MRRSPRICSVITLVVILVVAAFPPATAMTRREHRLLQMVNELRARHGMVLLRNDADLTRSAHRHSVRMAEANTLFHTQDPRMDIGPREDPVKNQPA